MSESREGAIIFVDLLSEAVDSFLKNGGTEVIKSSLVDLLDRGLPTGDDPHSILQGMRLIETIAANVISPFGNARILMIFRRVPLDIFASKLQSAEGVPHPLSSRPIIEYAVLFGTKLITSRVENQNEPVDRRSIMLLVPNNQELHSAVNLFVLSAFHGFLQYRLNTKSREGAANAEDFDTLIDSYNRRHGRRFEDQATEEQVPGKFLITPMITVGVEKEKRLASTSHPDRTNFIVNYRNYTPFCTSLDRVESLYRHLEGDLFRNRFGLTYAKWVAVYRAINAVLYINVTRFMMNSAPHASEPWMLKSSAERADDWGQAALGIAQTRILIESTAQTADELRLSADEQDVESFIVSHTAPRSASFNSFVEMPHCFYQLNNDSVFWDYIRFGSLLPVMRRMMAPVLGATGKSKAKGNSFESLIKHEIKIRVPTASAVSGPKKRRRDGNYIFELDVGFVMDSVLFIIEAKYQVHSQRYIQGNRNKVEDRMNDTIEKIEYLDSQLANNLEWVISEWANCEVKKVIGIVCTSEVEFIKTADPIAWLIYPDLPRICTLPELMTFLERSDWHDHVVACPAVQSI